MSRFRISTAPSEDDRQIAACLDRAEREVQAALRFANHSAQDSARRRRTERDLSRVLQVLAEVGTITPRYGAEPEISEPEARAAYLERKRLQNEKRAAVQSAAIEASDE